MDQLFQVLTSFAVDYTYESEKYSLTLYETAVPENYEHIRTLLYPEAHVFLICYSLTDVKKSIQKVTKKVSNTQGSHFANMV